MVGGTRPLSGNAPRTGAASARDQSFRFVVAQAAVRAAKRAVDDRESLLARPISELSNVLSLSRRHLQRSCRSGARVHPLGLPHVHPRHSREPGRARAHRRGVPQGAGGGRMTRRLETLVAEQAERRPDALAVVMGDERMTYGELDERSNQMANLLIHAGCKRGDRVALFMRKVPLTLVTILATLKAGAAYVPIDLSSPPRRVARVISACRPRFAAVTADGASQLDEALAETSGVPPCRVITPDQGNVGGERFTIEYDGGDIATAHTT